jgi:hypothetical protein
VRIVGHGHPAIRATHHKTLELTPAAAISERATCVVAVGVTPPGPIAGDVRITISAAGEAFSFRARGNSSWDPSGTAVIRRSPFRFPDTFATHASAVASDLPRALVEALQQPGNAIEIITEPGDERACAVLFALDPHRRHDPRLAAELAAADLIIADDEDAARLVGERVAHGAVGVEGRVLVLAIRDLPGATVVDALHDVDVETVGLPPALAAAAASPSRAPIVLAPDGTDPREQMRTAPAVARLVLAVRADDVEVTLRRAADMRGTRAAVAVQGSAPPIRIRPAEQVTLWSSAPVALCLDAATGEDALDPRVRAAVDALLADGVPTRTAAKALAALTGWDRRRAYEIVLSWSPGPSGS